MAERRERAAGASALIHLHAYAVALQYLRCPEGDPEVLSQFAARCKTRERIALEDLLLLLENEHLRWNSPHGGSRGQMPLMFYSRRFP